MSRRPPKSPLFPPTPLSRSLAARQLDPPLAALGAAEGRVRAVVVVAFLHQPKRLVRRERGARHGRIGGPRRRRSEEHTSELQSRQYLVCRLLLEKKKNIMCV